MQTFYFTVVVTIFFLLLFPPLFSAVANWMSTILLHNDNGPIVRI